MAFLLSLGFPISRCSFETLAFGSPKLMCLVFNVTVLRDET